MRLSWRKPRLQGHAVLELDLIRIDGDTQSRVNLDQSVVEEYAEAYRAGVQFPPVVVFFDGSDRWLADGFHRYFGAKAAGLPKIFEEVIPGTKLDAQLYSYGVNKAHGLRRTNADKRRAVEGALKHPLSGAWSDNQIAKHCGVSHTFVGSVRGSLATVASEEGPSPERTYTTKHGTQATMNTAKIGRTPAPAPAEAGDTPAAPPESEVSGTALDMTDSRGIDPAPAQRPKRAAQNPAPTVADDAGQALALALQEEVSALREQLQEAQADNASIAQILDASDQLAAAMEEAKRERDLARGLQSRINSLMTQVADLKRQVAHWKKKAGG